MLLILKNHTSIIAICIKLVIFQSFCFASDEQAGPPITVQFNTSSIGALEGSILVSGKAWLRFSPDLSVHHSGAWHDLKPESPAMRIGSDSLGMFRAREIVWTHNGAAVLTTAIRTYTSRPGLAVAVTSFTTALSNTTVNIQKEQPMFGFPSFDLSGALLPHLGYALWAGLWPFPVIKAGLNNTDRDGGVFPRRDGPILFTSASRESLLIGPLDDLLNTVYRAPSQSSRHPSLSFGPSGRIAQVDIGYTYSVVFISGNGPTDTFRRYGDVLQISRGVDPSVRFKRVPDTAVAKLSYWTDNGAYYFGKNLVRPDITLPGLMDSLLNDSHVDVGLLQLDGWWMQNPHLAANPKYFPDWEKFRNRLGQRGLLLYKSFFDEHDDLFNVSGCKVQSSKTGWWYPCAETAYQVYTHMFVEGKKLGMTAYETDFMSDHMLATPGLANTTSGLRLSLAGMAKAGKDQKIPMQWCMPTAAVVLFSVNLSAVSNARGSVDYATQGRENSSMTSTWPNTYAIGAAGLLFWAVDLPLSKDIIWTTTTQPGSPEQAPASQPNFEMDTALAVLSLGPVGIADGMGMTNVTLVNRTCRSDGVLLKPSKTLTAIDSTFVPVKWNREAKPYVGFLPLTPDGDCTRKRPCSPSVYQTHSTVSETTWHQLLSIHVGSFRPLKSDFFPKISAQMYIMRESRWTECKNGSTYAASKCAVVVSPSSLPDITTGPHRVDNTGAVAWKLFTFAPVLSNGWTLLGETTKIVPVSPVRFLSVDARGPCLIFTVSMGEREVITVGAVGPSNIYHSKILAVVKAGVVTRSFCGN